ncbi:PREDICTED: uncharacterized protein LOC105553809 [Mandrillus leucophaeus]|uniref:uncharacterized protein LOC105553809 n=1 Tax=Mandrillus leucophaeus TaxID=9568 RepID=UPI0005F38F7A|nr:PREDICTED: uncharacterized protein LOC105553809 [Mandrillus leucophaeus]
MNLVFCKSLGISVSPFYLHFLLSSQFPYPGPRPTSHPITPQTRFQDPIENDPFSDSCLSVGRSTGHRGAVFEIFDPGGHRAQRSGQDLGEGRLALRFDLPTNIREPNQRAHGGALRAVGEDEAEPGDSKRYRPSAAPLQFRSPSGWRIQLQDWERGSGGPERGRLASKPEAGVWGAGLGGAGQRRKPCPGPLGEGSRVRAGLSPGAPQVSPRPGRAHTPAP